MVRKGHQALGDGIVRGSKRDMNQLEKSEWVGLYAYSEGKENDLSSRQVKRIWEELLQRKLL